MAEDKRVNIETWAYGEVQRLKAEVARLKVESAEHQARFARCCVELGAEMGKRERAERERDLALLEAGKRFRCGVMRLRTDAEFIAEGRIAAGLDAAPAGEETPP
jgi:hypothetical protein